MSILARASKFAPRVCSIFTTHKFHIHSAIKYRFPAIKTNYYMSRHSFIKKGQIQKNFSQKCPKTASLLRSIPDLCTGSPFDYAFFSVLQPGSRIRPHCGPTNLRIRCHLALEESSPECPYPQNCSLAYLSSSPICTRTNTLAHAHTRTRIRTHARISELK